MAGASTAKRISGYQYSGPECPSAASEVQLFPGSFPCKLLFQQQSACAADLPPQLPARQQPGYRPRERLRAVGQKDGLPVLDRQAFGADRGGNYRQPGGPSLQNLQAGAAASQ